MLAKTVTSAAALLVLVIVLLGTAAGAVAGALTSPVTGIGQLLGGDVSPQQLTAAQYCALGTVMPGKPTAYGTFDTRQIENATTIYQVSVSLGLPAYAAQIAIATAMQESRLHNDDYGDRDSLGLFQQRPSQGWGTPAQIMNPVYAATKFYQALVKLPHWQSIPLTQAAQAVQRSAYPDAYQHWASLAGYLVASISGALAQCDTAAP